MDFTKIHRFLAQNPWIQALKSADSLVDFSGTKSDFGGFRLANLQISHEIHQKVAYMRFMSVIKYGLSSNERPTRMENTVMVPTFLD